jgi:hypothetical protein
MNDKERMLPREVRKSAEHGVASVSVLPGGTGSGCNFFCKSEFHS